MSPGGSTAHQSRLLPGAGEIMTSAEPSFSCESQERTVLGEGGISQGEHYFLGNHEYSGQGKAIGEVVVH